jgi:aryl-alcohol dehydrogenase-like predicted oxidoreductase
MDIRQLSPGRIGLGTYRMSIRSAEHRQALLLALQSGCKLIDTAANYTDGEAELLIGEVLQEHSEFSPLLITKAGYIQGAITQRLQDEGILDKIIKHSHENYDISLDPIFLESQINHSLKNLQQEHI